MGSYAASSGNFLPTFRGNLSVPSLGVKNPRILERWSRIQEGCPETSIISYHHSLLITQKSAVLIYHTEPQYETCDMGSYAANSGNFLQTFRDNLSVPSLGVKNTRILERWSRIQGGCSETSVINYQHSLLITQENTALTTCGGSLKSCPKHSTSCSGVEVDSKESLDVFVLEKISFSYAY